MLVKYIRANNLGVVLAIDADPSSNLNAVLGMPMHGSIGQIREEMLTKVSQGKMEAGISKQDYLDYRLNEILVEGNGVDLLAMGRPEGPGCYCAANNMLRLSVDRLSNSYDYVVIDNEAGLEHLSRRTTRDVDVMLIVSDPTMRGLEAAARVVHLVDEIKNKVDKMYLVLNKVDGDLPAQLQATVANLALDVAAVIPRDPLIAEYDAVGRPLVDLPDDSPTYRAVQDIATRIGLR